MVQYFIDGGGFMWPILITLIFGIGISIVGLLVFISLISYSPDDPNFIFPENTEIKNLLGFQYSIVMRMRRTVSFQ